jgi:hypothetical protein
VLSLEKNQDKRAAIARAATAAIAIANFFVLMLIFPIVSALLD